MTLRSGSLAALFMKTTDAASSASGEAMSRMGSTMWWRVTAGAKSWWDPSVAPVVYDGATPVTPVAIDYTGGRVLLGDVPAGAVTADFDYFAAAEVLGCQGLDLSIKFATEEGARFGDTAAKPEIISEAWTLSADRNQTWVNAYLETAFAGDDNDIRLTARDSGTPGHLISFETLGGLSKTLAVSVENGTDIIVQLGTDGAGVVTSTTNDVITVLQTNEAVMHLLEDVSLKTGDDGTGTPAVMAHTHLSGAVNPDWVTRVCNGEKMLVRAYMDDSSGSEILFEGLGHITAVDPSIGWNKLTKEPLDIQGYGKCYYVKL